MRAGSGVIVFLAARVVCGGSVVSRSGRGSSDAAPVVVISRTTHNGRIVAAVIDLNGGGKAHRWH